MYLDLYPCLVIQYLWGLNNRHLKYVPFSTLQYQELKLHDSGM